ncbi:zinc-binding oxidoreductase CipB [Xylariaceae sp. FL0255]|nr:zinc-binding oxidoreductase CipB [Xylariaceae sp. FL0255]
MPHQNRAAIIPKSGSYPLVVQDAPYTKPEPSEIVVRNKALALNPIDYILQKHGSFVLGSKVFPLVSGTDIAGEVVEVGDDVTRFKPGDRVTAFTSTFVNDNAHHGFQLYSVVKDHLAAPIPDTISFEQACVVGLGLATAACALFDERNLGLGLPRVGQITEKSPREVVLIWGGSTSVGCNAIQVSAAAGYDVITTCSPKNFEMVKSLGASEVFDYRSKDVTTQIVAAIGNRTVAGAAAIGDGSGLKCLEVMGQCQGRKNVAMITFPVPSDPDAGMLSTVWTFATGLLSLMIKEMRTGAKMKTKVDTPGMISGSGGSVWKDFIGDALKSGQFVTAPAPEVIGNKLEDIQKGLDMLQKGVSAKKLVISLSA